MMFSSRVWAGFLLAISALGTGEAQELAPTITGIIEAHGMLRPILGIPGSAHLGAPVAEGLRAAWPAPAQRWAIASRGEQTVLFRFVGPGFEVLENTDLGLLQDVTQVAWNVQGTSAVLFSANANRLQRIKVSKESVDAEPPTDLTFLQSSVSALAIDNDELIAFALPGSGIYYVDRSGSVSFGERFEAVSAIAFAEDSTLLVADSATKSVYALNTKDQTQSGSLRKLIEHSSAISAMAARSGLLHIASASEPKIRSYDLHGTLVRELELDHTLRAIIPMFRESAFLLNASGDQKAPVQMLDVLGDPTVFFVPAGEGNAL